MYPGRRISPAGRIPVNRSEEGGMEGRNLRVMSFNVRGASHRDGINAWEKRADLNVETIKRYAPDVIGLQEVHAPNLEVYEERLPDYARIMGPVYGTDKLEEFAAIFYDVDRFEELDAGGFWLSDTPEESSASWGNEVVRSANWAVLRDRRSGVAFLHANTHLDHLSEHARVEGNRLIVRQTEETLENHDHPPTIITGDFNCKPGSAPYEVFREHDFVDTFLAAGNEDGRDAYTFHAFKGTSFKPGDTDKPFGRIDWILLKDTAGVFDVQSHQIVRDADEEAGRYPSDHYPVLADLSITE
jgi:endonuclease/exonuclease/phosphatase family metal-dependent hydrolase